MEVSNFAAFSSCSVSGKIVGSLSLTFPTKKFSFDTYPVKSTRFCKNLTFKQSSLHN